MKKLSFFIALILFSISTLFSQVAINTDGSTPDASAMLDVKSINRGMLIPSMTLVQRDAISIPAKGLMIFCTNDNQFYFNSGTSTSPSWTVLNTQWSANSTNLYYNGGSVGIGTNLPAAKLDVNGNIAINGTPVINALGQWVGSPTGLVGPQGPAGLQGASGVQGPQGALGAQGPAGPAGSQGPTGATGATGFTGPQGSVGPAGPQGLTGAQGPQGVQGPQGIQGPTGPAVSTSALCVSGATGAQASCNSICGSGHLTSGTCGSSNCSVTSNTGSCSAIPATNAACCCLCHP